MKRHLFHILSGAVLALGFSLSASVLAQETIVYPDNFPPQALQTVNGAAYSLAPTGSSNGKSASLSGNSITVRSGGLALGSVYGAINLINSEMVTNNQVFINGHVQSSVYAGYHRNLDENVAEEGNTTVADNSLTIVGGTVSSAYGGLAWSKNAIATASNNSVTIVGGMISGYVSGGYALDRMSVATGNSVTISGGAAVFWGMYYSVYGGNASVSASNNSVTISSDARLVDRMVVGGYTGARGTASDNSVTIRGASLFNVWGLYGGIGEVSTGNTLNLHSIGTVGKISAFQNLNFYLPTMLAAGGTMLTVTEAADTSDVTKVSVGLEGDGPPLRAGDWFILSHVVSCKPKDDATCGYGDFQPVSGTVGGHSYTVAKEGACLVLTIGDQQRASPAQCTSPGRDYTGQWISADGEDAWGLTVLANFQSNPRYIFVPWYTYDKEGKAAWYVFQGGNWTANDTITAEVYRYTGPAWGTHDDYDSDAVDNKVVGTATLTFTSATTARFKYSVEGAERTINLDRLDGVSSTGGFTRQLTGQWIKADEDAWGLTVLGGFPSKPDYLFVPWYTYDKDGNATWYIFQGESRWVYDSWDNGQLEMSADVYRYTGPTWGVMPYDNDRIVDAKVGTAKLTFRWGVARFEYDVEGESRAIDLRKLE